MPKQTVTRRYVTGMGVGTMLAGWLTTACGANASSSSPSTSKAAPAERVVKHALGETTVPANPQRVVVLDQGEIDMTAAVGVKPVGLATYLLDADLPPYLDEKVKDAKRVGTVAEPNLETLLLLKPDLILTNKLRHEAIADKLAQIAPTVFAETVKGQWKSSFQIHTNALNKAKEAEQIMGKYDSRVAEFRKAMGDRLQQTKVSLVRSFPDHVRIYMKDSFMGTIISDAGLPRPAAQDKEVFMERATEERIPDLDGDVIFLMYYNKAKGEQISALKKSPLWSQLSAVKAGRVYEVDDDIWGTGLGPLAANAVLDDLFKYLVK